MANETPGAYRPGGRLALTDCAWIRGTGKPGTVTIPFLITWLRSACRTDVAAEARDGAEAGGGCAARGTARLCRSGKIRAPADAHLVGHEQPQVPDQGRAELVVAQVGAADVDPEALAGQAAAVGEGDLEVQLGPVLSPVGGGHAVIVARPRRRRR